MNLHIDKEEFDWLMAQPKVGQFTIGSELYELNDEHSDKDYLIILYPFYDVINSPFSSHHQFQYKDVENNIDYNFVDIVTFIKNLVSGDSTVNFELLYSEEFQADENLRFIWRYRNYFHTYNIMKSYLGMADRDIRHIGKKQGRDKISAMLHIQRGRTFVGRLMDNRFFLNIAGFDYIKNENYLSSFLKNIAHYREELKVIRQEVTKRYERGELSRYLDPNIQNIVNTGLIALLLNKDGLEYSFLKRSLHKKIYDSNEKIEITY